MANKLNTNSFNQLAIAKYPTFNYSMVNYINCNTPVDIICPIHGLFSQTPLIHLWGSKYGCPKCSRLKVNDWHKRTKESFILEAVEIYKEYKCKYDYSNIVFVNMDTKVSISCSLHGPFLVTPHQHLYKKSGCPNCRKSKGELHIKYWLDYYGINYVVQYKIADCKDINCLPFDFYLPDFNMCIEYQGEQHYHAVSLFGGEEGYKLLQSHDLIKRSYCETNNIVLLCISFKEQKNIKNIIRGIITNGK